MKNINKSIIVGSTALLSMCFSSTALSEITVRFGSESHLSNKNHINSFLDRYPPNLRNPTKKRPYSFKKHDYNPYYNSFYGRPSTSYYYNNGNTRIIIQDNIPLDQPSINYYDYRNHNNNYKHNNGNHFYNKGHKKYIPK